MSRSEDLIEYVKGELSDLDGEAWYDGLLEIKDYMLSLGDFIEHSSLDELMDTFTNVNDEEDKEEF